MIFFQIVSFFVLVLVQDKTNWKLERDKDGVQVYTRLREGENIKEFKAVTRVEASLTSAVALVRDTEVTPEWYNHVKSGAVVEKFDEQKSIVRLEIDFPFPANDRDLIVHFYFYQDSLTGEVRAEVTGKPDHLPEQKGFIRIRKIEGSWRFKQVTEREVEVEYQFFTDPGGKLPAWLINMFIVDDPYKSLRRMKDYVKKEKYKNVEFGFITR